MERKINDNELLNDGDSLSYENMIRDWKEAEKFDEDDYGDLSFTLKEIFFNKLRLITDLDLRKRINDIIHPWKK